MSFKYNKINAQCFWCKRTMNPHPDYRHETIPTKNFKTLKGRNIELCFSCYEDEQNKAKFNNINFKKNLDKKFETMKMLNLNCR